MLADPARDTDKINAELPPSLFALVDGERIEKVVENLVLNALESKSKDKGTLTVQAGTTHDQKVFFSVTDTGVGMAPDSLRSVCTVRLLPPRGKGMGLGSTPVAKLCGPMAALLIANQQKVLVHRSA